VWTGAKAAHRVLVASGRIKSAAAGTGRLTITLTAAGARLLRHKKSLKLRGTATFTHPGSSPVTASRSFRLAR
jgi:hypothetical protein